MMNHLEATRHGCILKHLEYKLDEENDVYYVEMTIQYLSAPPRKPVGSLDIKLYNPTNVFLARFNNDMIIEQLEIIDYKEHGYEADHRYLFHDIEEDSIHLFCSHYEVVSFSSYE